MIFFDPIISDNLWRCILDRGAAFSRAAKALIFTVAEEKQYHDEDLRSLVSVYYRQAYKYPERKGANRTDDNTRESGPRKFFNITAGLVRRELSDARESGSGPFSRSLIKRPADVVVTRVRTQGC